MNNKGILKINKTINKGRQNGEERADKSLFFITGYYLKLMNQEILPEEWFSQEWGEDKKG